MSNFEPFTIAQLTKILGITIKLDDINKSVTFLVMLSAYTEEAQLNLSFNAPSSTGKSYLPLEIANLFPKEDVIELGSSSPTAFFHEFGKYDEESNTNIVDLSRKIIIFLDQPNSALLARLRPILSHDRKEILFKITDKNQKGGNRTKNVKIIGYPAVIFCSANLEMDEQESTRFILLSPEISAEKNREAIIAKIRRKARNRLFKKSLAENPERKNLMNRIVAIKQEGIDDIEFENTLIEKKFFERTGSNPKSRHMRDVDKIMNLVKVCALLNCRFRNREENTLLANDYDIETAFTLWDQFSESQEYNMPPYVLGIYKDVILPLYNEELEKVNQDSSQIAKELFEGISKEAIKKRHYQNTGRFIPDWELRQQILPLLETAGLIGRKQDPINRRQILVYPTALLTKSDENSELTSGVEGSSDEEIERLLDDL